MTSTSTAVVEQDEAANLQKPSNPKTPMSSYRMLYRGSLALPDSEMLLDGINFVMQIARNSPMSLINSPIPLGLESMRGRSLRLISTVSIRDTYVECFGDVSMYIHPDAFLTRAFFERTLCTDSSTAPLLPDSNFTYLRTSVAVRIGLGDGAGPEESDILVFGQLSTPGPANPILSTPATISSPKILQLLAGRIAPPAPAQQLKIIRPDDPLPRPHPLSSLHLSPGRRGIKRKRSSNTSLGPFLSAPNAGTSSGNGDAGSALMAALAQAQAQGERLKKQGKIVANTPSAKGLSKRPALFQSHHSAPSTSSSRGQSVDRDGFLVPDIPVRVLTVRQKDKDKGKSPLKPGDAGAGSGSKGGGEIQNGMNAENLTGAAEPESEMEERNKTAIKKRTLSALEACGISKQHAQFRDLYGWIHRGVAFAVRGVIQETKVDRDLLTKLIEVHLEMYMGGRGGKYQSQVQNQVQSPATSRSQASGGATTKASSSPLNPERATALIAKKSTFDHIRDSGPTKTDPCDSDMDLAFGSRSLPSSQTTLDIPTSRDSSNVFTTPASGNID